MEEQQTTIRLSKPRFKKQGNVLYFYLAFRHFRKNCQKGYELRHICLSVCPHGTTRLPLDRFLMKLHILEFFENMSKKIKYH